jgi:hypothetical protein
MSTGTVKPAASHASVDPDRRQRPPRPGERETSATGIVSEEGLVEALRRLPFPSNEQPGSRTRDAARP